MIIDIHTHLGDILNLGGGDLIDKKGVTKEKIFDIINISEAGQMRTYGLDAVFYRALDHWITKAERARNATASLENEIKSMDDAGVDYTVCMPIAPYVTFDDLYAAYQKNKRVLPFTSVDFNSAEDASKKLASDVKRGAFGLKLHPIIQSISLNDRRVMEALQAFEPLKKPVLTHAGVSNYYLGKERARNIPQNGQIRYIEGMVKTFPNIRFIIGHSGLFQCGEVMKRLRGCRNVWVDTSFQSPEKIRKLVKIFGEDRVMYASDWPYGNRVPAIKTVRTACKKDKKLEERLLYANARDILGLKE